MARPKTIDDVHKGIESFLEETKREVYLNLEEPEQNNQWVLNVKQESYKFKILHPLDKSYFYIVFSFEADNLSKELLTKIYSESNKVVDFNYGLISSISFPNTFCYFRKMSIPKSDYIYAGFDIVARVFPFEETYSNQDLEYAIQNVINAGRLGKYFFVVTLKSSREVIKQIEDLDSSPEGMFT